MSVECCTMLCVMDQRILVITLYAMNGVVGRGNDEGDESAK